MERVGKQADKAMGIATDKEPFKTTTKMKKLMFLGAAIMGLFVTMTACAKKNETTRTTKKEGKTLVAYFSATGTTEQVAKMIATATEGELYKIEPQKAYSDADLDWRDKSSRCCQENDNPASRPAIVKNKASLDEYEVIYLGFPNWWNGAPRIINTFIETYGLKGKTVIPFMTSGGNGIENAEQLLKKAYPEVDWQKGRLLNGASLDEVKAWVKK